MKKYIVRIPVVETIERAVTVESGTPIREVWDKAVEDAILHEPKVGWMVDEDAIIEDCIEGEDD